MWSFIILFLWSWHHAFPTHPLNLQDQRYLWLIHCLYIYYPRSDQISHSVWDIRSMWRTSVVIIHGPCLGRRRILKRILGGEWWFSAKVIGPHICGERENWHVFVHSNQGKGFSGATESLICVPDMIVTWSHLLLQLLSYKILFPLSRLEIYSTVFLKLLWSFSCLGVWFV